MTRCFCHRNSKVFKFCSAFFVPFGEFTREQSRRDVTALLASFPTSLPHALFFSVHEARFTNILISIVVRDSKHDSHALLTVSFASNLFFSSFFFFLISLYAILRFVRNDCGAQVDLLLLENDANHRARSFFFDTVFIFFTPLISSS